MTNKLYEYFTPTRAQVIVEKSQDGRDLFMKGIFVQADVRNQNQRVYPLHEITKAINTVNEKLKGGESVLGELDHPEELSINLDRVSHVITEMWMDGHDGHGTLKMLPTPCGNIARALIDANVKLGVSSRGSGNVGHDGGVSDFDIVTVDLVAQPSAPSAYPTSIYESLYNMQGGAQIVETARAAHVDHVAEKYLAKDVLKLIRELKL